MSQFLLGLLFLLISAIFLSAFVIAIAVGNRETGSVYLIIILSVLYFWDFHDGILKKRQLKFLTILRIGPI